MTMTPKEGLGLASEVKVLCATRFGPLGVFAWSACIEAIAAARSCPGTGIGGRSYVGRPIIVTRNDYFNKLFNGDVGLVVAGLTGPVVAFSDPGKGLRKLALSQLGDIDTWWATTIHKSQGSEFGQVIVTLPAASVSDTDPRAPLHRGHSCQEAGHPGGCGGVAARRDTPPGAESFGAQGKALAGSDLAYAKLRTRYFVEP